MQYEVVFKVIGVVHVILAFLKLLLLVRSFEALVLLLLELVAEPPELSRLKCAGHHHKGNTG